MGLQQASGECHQVPTWPYHPEVPVDRSYNPRQYSNIVATQGKRNQSGCWWRGDALGRSALLSVLMVYALKHFASTKTHTADFAMVGLTHPAAAVATPSPVHGPDVKDVAF